MTSIRKNWCSTARVIERAGFRVGVIGSASNIVDKSMPPSYSQGCTSATTLPRTRKRWRRAGTDRLGIRASSHWPSFPRLSSRTGRERKTDGAMGAAGHPGDRLARCDRSGPDANRSTGRCLERAFRPPLSSGPRYTISAGAQLPYKRLPCAAARWDIWPLTVKESGDDE